MHCADWLCPGCHAQLGRVKIRRDGWQTLVLGPGVQTLAVAPEPFGCWLVQCGCGRTKAFDGDAVIWERAPRQQAA